MSPELEQTLSILRAAATDTGNRSMRENGRDKWNEEDWDAAAEHYERLIFPILRMCNTEEG